MKSFKTLMIDIINFDVNQFSIDWRWKVLHELYEKNYVMSVPHRQQRIPKKIHQIWLGSALPEKYKVWAETWKRLNPEYEYKLWTDNDVKSLHLPNQEAYDSIINYGPKSDILRYHILNQFGGIYIDTDFECIKSFDDLQYLEFYTGVGYPSKVELYPGLIACTPHHPIIKKITEEINKVTKVEIKKLGVLGATSSYFFTDVFFTIVKKYQKGVVAFPPAFFYPFPNHKGHSKEDGRKYIVDCSYAVHHWEVSWKIPFEYAIDWIQGDKFVKFADFVYAPQNKASDDYAKYPNTFDPSELKDLNFVYTNAMYLARLLRILPNLPYKFVVMSHNGDQHIEDGIIGTYANGERIASESYILSDNIIKMYVQNVDVIHPRIDTIPIGLENSMWGKSGKKEIMLNTIYKIKKGVISKRRFVYMNHSLNTRREERTMLYEKFAKTSWVTSTPVGKGSSALYEYFNSLAEHKFVMNPWGNGFDTHRMWEAFYLECIPITRRCIFTSFYEDFPICLIDSWDEVTEDFLNKEYERIHNMVFDRDKLTFEYWQNQVKSIK